MGKNWPPWVSGTDPAGEPGGETGFSGAAPDADAFAQNRVVCGAARREVLPVPRHPHREDPQELLLHGHLQVHQQVLLLRQTQRTLRVRLSPVRLANLYSLAT